MKTTYVYGTVGLFCLVLWDMSKPKHHFYLPAKTDARLAVDYAWKHGIITKQVAADYLNALDAGAIDPNSLVAALTGLK